MNKFQKLKRKGNVFTNQRRRIEDTFRPVLSMNGRKIILTCTKYKRNGRKSRKFVYSTFYFTHFFYVNFRGINLFRFEINILFQLRQINTSVFNKLATFFCHYVCTWYMWELFFGHSYTTECSTVILIFMKEKQIFVSWLHRWCNGYHACLGCGR
jgi:hypothetical protein